jgi:hypothetical protein
VRDPTNWPDGLATVNNTLAGATNDSIAGATISFINQNLLVKNLTIENLKQSSSGEVLLTTWQITSDGNGTTTSGIQAGGSYGGVSYATQGLNAFVSGTDFMKPGLVVTYAGGDSRCELNITSRGLNMEWYGLDSDLTEAPEPGRYTAVLTFRMTYPVP